MAIWRKKCSDKPCQGKSKKGEPCKWKAQFEKRFCFKCERELRKAMEDSGYLETETRNRPHMAKEKQPVTGRNKNRDGLVTR